MKLSKTKWVALALLTATLPGLSQSAPAEMPQITVNVYNDARVPEQVLAKAKGEAARIFRRADVKIIWIDCSAARGPGARDPACANPMDRSHLAVRIVPWSSTSGDAVFGVAFLSSEGNGAYTDVFYDSVEKLHSESHAGIPILLGHVIAHEMGHLLLGTNAHTGTGIMRPKWQGEELQSLAMGKLLFTPPQVESFKARLSAVPR